MEKLVAMLIICWTPHGNELHEEWRIEKTVPLEHCLTMNRVVTGGGKAGAVTVRCGFNGG